MMVYIYLNKLKGLWRAWESMWKKWKKEIWYCQYFIGTVENAETASLQRAILAPNLAAGIARTCRGMEQAGSGSSRETLYIISLTYPASPSIVLWILPMLSRLLHIYHSVSPAFSAAGCQPVSTIFFNLSETFFLIKKILLKFLFW